MELQPQFSLYDAYVSITKPLPHDGVLTLDLGQMRVPMSRQQLISDTRRAFVDAAQIATIAPDRDLGVKLWYVPSQLHMVRLIGGVFNGEGRDQIQNINERYLWAGRIEVTPFGDVEPYAESAFAGNWLTFAFNAGHNVLTPGVYEEKQITWGYDVSGCWRGLSGSFEYLQVNHYYEGDPTKFPGKDYHANGFDAQLNYMLPLELYRGTKLEIGARVEEIDRDDTDPIEMPGDPNQSLRIYTAVISYYLRQHQMKIQLAGYHFTRSRTAPRPARTRRIPKIRSSGKSPIERSNHARNRSHRSLSSAACVKGNPIDYGDFVGIGGTIAIAGCHYSFTTQPGAEPPKCHERRVRHRSDADADPPELDDRSQDLGRSRSGARTTRPRCRRTFATRQARALPPISSRTWCSGIEFGFRAGGTDGEQHVFTMHQVHLCNLAAGTTYSYQVGGHNPYDNTDHWSDVFTFHTAPDVDANPDAEVLLGFVGDSRGGYDVWQQLVTLLQARAPDLSCTPATP